MCLFNSHPKEDCFLYGLLLRVSHFSISPLFRCQGRFTSLSLTHFKEILEFGLVPFRSLLQSAESLLSLLPPLRLSSLVAILEKV